MYLFIPLRAPPTPRGLWLQRATALTQLAVYCCPSAMLRSFLAWSTPATGRFAGSSSPTCTSSEAWSHQIVRAQFSHSRISSPRRAAVPLVFLWEGFLAAGNPIVYRE